MAQGRRHPAAFALVLRGGGGTAVVCRCTSRAVAGEVVLALARSPCSPGEVAGEVRVLEEEVRGLGEVARRAKRSLAGSFTDLIAKRRGGERLGRGGGARREVVVPIIKVEAPKEQGSGGGKEGCGEGRNGRGRVECRRLWRWAAREVMEGVRESKREGLRRAAEEKLAEVR